MYIVHLRNGRTITENEMDWGQLKAETNNLQDITSIQLKRGNQLFTVSVDGNKAELIQLKRAEMGIGAREGVTERVVGCIVGGDTKYAIKLVINEATGNAKLTVEEKKPSDRWRKL